MRRSGDQLRITAQLIDASTEAHLWAQRYDRDVGDIFAVQDEVTRRIVDALQVTLADLEASRLGHRGTESVEAHDFYLRGHDQFYRFTPAGVEAAIELFARAIELDPSHAEAYLAQQRAISSRRTPLRRSRVRSARGGPPRTADDRGTLTWKMLFGSPPDQLRPEIGL